MRLIEQAASTPIRNRAYRVDHRRRVVGLVQRVRCKVDIGLLSASIPCIESQEFCGSLNTHHPCSSRICQGRRSSIECSVVDKYSFDACKVFVVFVSLSSLDRLNGGGSSWFACGT
jgi:hypothetical protein